LKDDDDDHDSDYKISRTSTVSTCGSQHRLANPDASLDLIGDIFDAQLAKRFPSNVKAEISCLRHFIIQSDEIQIIKLNNSKHSAFESYGLIETGSVLCFKFAL
jgi:hypothetical protein